MLTWVVLTAVLNQTPPDEEGRELSLSAELTGGRQLGFSSFVDFELVPDALFLSAGYSLLKPPPLAATDTSPAVPTAATHVFYAGADWSLGSHFTLSGLFSASPKATDAVVLNPQALPVSQVTVTTHRSSIGGSLMAAWNSAGLSKLEWTVDGGASATANRLGNGLKVGGLLREPPDDALVAIRALLGLTLTIFGATDVCLRAGYTAYTANPLTAGHFDLAELTQLQGTAGAAAGTFATQLESLNQAAQQAQSRLGLADSLAGYASAPVWVELKLSVLHRFGRHWSAQLGWTFDRYVPTAGYANIVSSKVTLKLAERWRLWVAGALQLDQSVDHPSPGTRPSVSGLGSLGAELTL